MNQRTVRGFTLLELVIVISIIAILGVSVLIRTNTSSMINLGGQAQQVANDIRYAQALAMSKNQRYYFIRQSTTTYQIFNASTGTAIIFPTGGTTITLNTGITMTTNLPSNLVAFDGKGIPYTTTTSPGTALASTGTITLQAGSTTQTISIVPQTGSLSIS